MADITFTHLNRACTEVRIALDGAADRAHFLLTSDEHVDSAHSDKEMFARHLEEAKEKGAYVISNGDMMDAMQGKWDKRSNQDELIPELRGEDYLDKLVSYTADFLEPHADSFLLIGRGNHETGIKRHHQTDLTERLVGTLNDRCKTHILSGGYAGWIIFKLTRAQQKGSFRMYRHHGAGGNAPVTKGVIQSARIAPWTPDADICLTGHTHTEWILPVPRQRVTPYGKIFYDEQLHVRVPGYKQGLQDGFEGYETEKMFAPTNVGAAWLEFWWQQERGTRRMEFKFDVRRAK